MAHPTHGRHSHASAIFVWVANRSVITITFDQLDWTFFAL